MTDLFAAILTNLELSHLLVVLAGTLAGLIIGALPGLSAVSGVALMLPFTFTMDPAQGLIMLAAVYMAAEYGGSISAILLNTPGTSGAACTMLDGYPLTKQGRAQDALYTSLLASSVGGLMGALILIFFTPTLARASLLLGPAEIFWVAVAGLALVASLSGHHTIKGLIGALVGVGLTLIGQDLTTGQMRFTFDNYHLVGGIPLVPALLGLFAVASILALLEQPHQPVAPLIMRKGVLGECARRLAGMKRLLVWSGLQGAIIGVIPGAGASIAAFVSYAEAKRLSKRPEEFGKGSFEGVAAPESANNAIVGGAMVPLLALGIPGSGSAAIMFGALTVHGLLPGPRLFTERADIVNTFMVGILFSVFAMLLIGLLTIRWSSMVVRAPRKAMVPGVLVLSMVGTYGMANSLFDVYVLLAIGIVAYVLAKIDISPVTIALGLVLGKLIEGSFQQVAIIGPIRAGSTLGFFLSRPLAVVLMLLALVILVAGIVQILRMRRGATTEVLAATADTRPGLSLRTANIGFALTMIALAVYVLVVSAGFWDQAALFPRMVAIGWLVLAGILLAVNVIPSTGRSRAAYRPFADVPWARTLTIIVLMLVLAWATPLTGFYEGAFVFLAVVYWLLSGDVSDPLRRIGGALVFAVGFAGLCYLLFNRVFQIATPPGLLF